MRQAKFLAHKAKLGLKCCGTAFASSAETHVGWQCMSNPNELGQFIPLHYHYQMLGDEVRMRAFAEAIACSMPPGGRAIELGSGTGVLSFLTSKLASRVTAVEFNPDMVSASRRFLERNGVAEIVTVIEHDAATYIPDEPVDLVICEMLHSGLLREKQTSVIKQFKRGYLEKFGSLPRFLPEATLLAAQPVNQSYDFHGYLAPVPFFQEALLEAPGCCALAEPTVYAAIDYCEGEIPEKYAASLEFKILVSGPVNAIRFITKNLLSIDMQSGKSVDWLNQHLVLPLPVPIRMQVGENMMVDFSYVSGGSIESLVTSLRVTNGKAIPSAGSAVRTTPMWTERAAL